MVRVRVRVGVSVRASAALSLPEVTQRDPTPTWGGYGEG